MRKLLFGTIVVLSTILASCGSTISTEETKTTTEDSTKVETTTITTPSVDTTKAGK